MARKDVLKGLLGLSEPSETPLEPPLPHRSNKGAIGVVSRSIADLKARSVIEVDPGLIDAGGVQDRLEADSVSDGELMRSIAEYGQQVPVLVRPHPSDEGRFQIVYGRRRLLALRALKQPVKALVRDLDDLQLVMAQGQENTARRDLSFIEKVNFARQMADAGYQRKVICDALNIDKTLISRMLSVAERVSVAVIAAVGPAHGIGRDRWLDLAAKIETLGLVEATLLASVTDVAGAPSDARFETLMAAVTPEKEPEPAQPLLGADGQMIGEQRAGGRTLTLRLDRKATRGFESWLIAELPRLHAEWLQTDEAKATPKRRH